MLSAIAAVRNNPVTPATPQALATLANVNTKTETSVLAKQEVDNAIIVDKQIKEISVIKENTAIQVVDHKEQVQKTFEISQKINKLINPVYTNTASLLNIIKGKDKSAIEAIRTTILNDLSDSNDEDT